MQHRRLGEHCPGLASAEGGFEAGVGGCWAEPQQAEMRKKGRLGGRDCLRVIAEPGVLATYPLADTLLLG